MLLIDKQSVSSSKTIITTHANNSRGSKAFSGISDSLCVCVCLFVQLINVHETKITKLGTGIVHPCPPINIRSKGQGHRVTKCRRQLSNHRELCTLLSATGVCSHYWKRVLWNVLLYIVEQKWYQSSVEWVSFNVLWNVLSCVIVEQQRHKSSLVHDEGWQTCTSEERWVLTVINLCPRDCDRCLMTVDNGSCCVCRVHCMLVPLPRCTFR